MASGKPTQRDRVTTRRLEKVAKRWRTKHDASMDRHADRFETVFDASVKQTTPLVNGAIDALETGPGGTLLPTTSNRKLIAKLDADLTAARDTTYGPGGPVDGALAVMGDDALGSGLKRYKDTAAAADQKLPPPNFTLSAAAMKRWNAQVEQLRLGFYGAETVNTGRYLNAFLLNIADPKGTRAKLRSDLTHLGFDSPKPMLDTLGRRITTSERADRIARYEFPRLARIAEDEAIDQHYYGGKPPSPAQRFYLWTAVGDARTQPEHLARHGKVLSLADWNKRDFGDGRVGLAPLRPRCRCDSVFVDKKWFSAATQQQHFGADAQPLLEPIPPPPVPKPKPAPAPPPVTVAPPSHDPALPVWAEKWYDPTPLPGIDALKTTGDVERWLVDGGHVKAAFFRGFDVDVARDIARDYTTLKKNFGRELDAIGDGAKVKAWLKENGWNVRGSPSSWGWFFGGAHDVRVPGSYAMTRERVAVIAFNKKFTLAANNEAWAMYRSNAFSSNRWHASAAYTPRHRSTMFHEYGHALDWNGQNRFTSVSQNEDLRAIYDAMGQRYFQDVVARNGESAAAGVARRGLADYSAEKGAIEYPSEAFDAFMLNAREHTTEMAEQIVELALKRYGVAIPRGYKAQLADPGEVAGVTRAVLARNAKNLRLAKTWVPPEGASADLIAAEKNRLAANAARDELRDRMIVERILASVADFSDDFVKELLKDADIDAVYGDRIRKARGL